MENKIKIGPQNKKRLLKDVVDIIKSPLESEGIYYQHSQTNMLNGYALVIGPKDTIYENGYYLFKFDFPSDYPYSPPKLTYLTNNGYTRFNPNLYISGKVCISLLNTWRGEQWTSCQTIKTVLLTLITLFHNKALLNEPGVKESHLDFKNYHLIINYQNYKTAILNILNKKFLPFEFMIFYDTIKKHALENKERNFENLRKLTEKYDNKQYSTGIYSMSDRLNYSKVFNELKKTYEKIIN
tara:strand:+ start:55 stop:774 length:720 start_codon:yes stop_codon:yes gene_type:complete